MKINIKNRQQLLVIVALAAVGLFAADKIVLTPLGALWKERTTQINELSRKVDSGRSLLQNEARWRRRWDEMRANTLPSDPSRAEQQVHKAFDRWLQDSRVNILSLSSQWKHDSEDYMTLECRAEASGDLWTITKFLYDIERDPMALRLQAVELSSRDNNGRQLALGLQVSGLVLTPQEQRR